VAWAGPKVHRVSGGDAGEPSAHRISIAPENSALARSLTRVLIEVQFDPTRLLEVVGERRNDEGESLALRFLCSLLSDLASWGAQFEVHQSHLWASVPSLQRSTQDPLMRDRLRNSMERLRGEVTRYEPSVSPEEAASAIWSGVFALDRVDSPESDESGWFKAGIGTWSMPYRPREGRSSRYVLTVTHEGRRIPAGLLEVGDDAPRNPPRDNAMGLAGEIVDLNAQERSSLGVRLAAIRGALLPDGLPANFDGPYESLVPRIDELARQGVGRTGTFDEISQKKRLTYLSRLVRGEMACAGERGGAIGDGLRAIRDLSIPRSNLEMTICGALPPFGGLLVGKLTASMACHPEIRAFVDREFGEITRSLFDVSRLEQLLPRHGALMVTTRGLYPVHSSQYNGVACPGLGDSRVRLRKLGDTEGQTASHISDLTMRLAIAFNHDQGGMQTSRVYGAGGAKRQRILVEALRKAGLPVALSHASISRPVYGISLVSNLRRVMLLNDLPNWSIEPYGSRGSSADYVEKAVALWRDRWSGQLMTRAGREID